MPDNIAEFLEQSDEDFDLNEAMAYMRDMRIETDPHNSLIKYLAKLDRKIKAYIRAYGEIPQVEKVRIDITPKKDTDKVTVKDVQLLAGQLMAEGENDIAQRVLALVKTVPNTSSIKFVYEDLVY